MNADPLDTRIAEIEARVNAASEGPWEPLDAAADEARNVVPWVGYTRSDGQIELVADCEQECGRADAAFIANAREDIPFLLAALRDTREALRDLLDLAERVRAGDPSLDPEEWYARRDYARVTLARAALAPEQTEGAA